MRASPHLRRAAGSAGRAPGRRRRRAPRFPPGRRRARGAGRGRLQRPAGVRGAQARARREAGQGAALPVSAAAAGTQNDPVQPRLQQGPVLQRRRRALGRAHEVQRRLPGRALRGRARSRPTPTARCGPSRSARTRSGPTAAPCTARDFEWSWKRQIDPASKAPVRRFFYDIKDAEAVQQEQGDRTPPRSACRPRTTGRSRSRSRGRAATSRCCRPTWRRFPAHRPSVEKHGDKWTEAANIVCNGPFVLEAWEHNKVMVLRKNKHFFGAKDVTLEKVTIPIIPVAVGRAARTRTTRSTSRSCRPPT